MNPFAQLIAMHQRPPQAIKTATGYTEKMRQALRRSDVGLTCQDLADASDLENVCQVPAMMRHDVRKGAVIKRDGLYYWNHDYDGELAASLAAAAVLLRRHGYNVEKLQ